MNSIPRPALVLGVAGLIPFVWGALSFMSPHLTMLGATWFGPRFIGPYVQIAYGTVILAFMSGVLWGFATKAEAGQAWLAYGLSVIPALWAFLFVGGGPFSAQIYLIVGFLGVLGIDWAFWTNSLTPPWWMRLRVGLTAVVVLCLGLGVI